MKETNPHYQYLLKQHGGDKELTDAVWRAHFKRAALRSVESRRARSAAKKSAGADAYVSLLLSLAPKLTDQQRCALAELLKPTRQ